MEDRLHAAYRHCRAETRREARNFYWAFITLPRPKRAAIYAVYSLFRKWDDIADSAGSPNEKRRALEEQREIIRMLYADNLNLQTWNLRACEPDSFEPVLLAVGDVIHRYEIPRRYFEDVLTGVELDLEKSRYRTFQELREYCYGVAAAVGLISLEIFGYRGPKAKEYAIDLGIAMQLVNILRDVKEDLERGRIYLPQEDLERFGYSEEELRRGTVNDSFRRLMRFQVSRAREYFARGRKLLSYLPLRSRPCPAVLAGLYRHILKKIETCGYDVFNGKITLTPREKLAILLSAPLESLLYPRKRYGHK